MFNGPGQFKGCCRIDDDATKMRSPHSYQALSDRGRLPQMAEAGLVGVGRMDLKTELGHLENVKLVANAAPG